MPGDEELLEPPRGYSSGLIPIVPRVGGKLPDPPPMGNPGKERIVDKFARTSFKTPHWD